MASIFDAKAFNAEVFGKYVDTVSDLRRNELLKSGVFRVRNDIKAMFPDQTGGNYAMIPMKAPIGGDAVNYDGSTNITANSRKTYTQGMVVVGRAKGFVEKDFSYDITGGNDFLPVASEVAHYWDNVDQDTILAILKGIFSMTTGDNAKFVSEHTTDISGASTADAQVVGATTLNSAIQKATGDNKNIFKVAIMHSVVATHLENLNLLNYLKYTDANGIQRDLGLATWNGRLVLIDDNMPTENVAKGDSVPEAYTKYTTYILGDGAFDYVDCGVKVPYEMDRNPAQNGGETTLYTRQRKLFAPHGISYAPTSIPLSPLNSSLEAGASWTLAHDSDTSSKSYFPHKAIPIARIISRG